MSSFPGFNRANAANKISPFGKIILVHHQTDHELLFNQNILWQNLNFILYKKTSYVGYEQHKTCKH